jgi:hypothetical protein
MRKPSSNTAGWVLVVVWLWASRRLMPLLPASVAGDGAQLERILGRCIRLRMSLREGGRKKREEEGSVDGFCVDSVRMVLSELDMIIMNCAHQIGGCEATSGIEKRTPESKR